MTFVARFNHVIAAISIYLLVGSSIHQVHRLYTAVVVVDTMCLWRSMLLLTLMVVVPHS